MAMKLKLLYEIMKYTRTNPGAKPWLGITRDICLFKKVADKQTIANTALEMEMKANACRFAMIAMNKFDSDMSKEERLLREWKNILLATTTV